MHQHLGISTALEGVATADQLLLQHQIVFDDAIVDEGDLAVGGEMRVGVLGIGFTVGGPAGMADTRMCRHILVGAHLVQVGHSAATFV